MIIHFHIMLIVFIHRISLLYMSHYRSMLSKVTDLQVGGKSFLQFCFLLSVAFLYFFWHLWSRRRLVHRGIRQSLCPSYNREEIVHHIKALTELRTIYCHTSVWLHITGVQTLIFSDGNLWHRARGILSAEGSFGLAWTLTGTVPLADHEPTNAWKGVVIHLLAIYQYIYLQKYNFH